MGKNQDAVDRATAAVTKATSVEASATALIASIIAAARENATDPTALNAAMDAFEAKTTELGDAVVANTPAENPPA